MDYWKWMISPDCCLIVTKRSALLIFAMKMVPKPSSGWQKWNVRPTGYYLELLPNFLPLALVETSLVSEVGGAWGSCRREGKASGIYLFVSSCFLAAQCAHGSNYFKWNHVSPFALFHYWKVSTSHLSMSVLPCFELPSFLWDGAAEVSLGGCRKVWTLGIH